jgi:hypothetical protein
MLKTLTLSRGTSKHASASDGAVTALDRVSLSIEPGAFVVALGGDTGQWERNAIKAATNSSRRPDWAGSEWCDPESQRPCFGGLRRRQV